MQRLPDIPEYSTGYLVCKGNETLYWGYSRHVARLIALVMAADYY